MSSTTLPPHAQPFSANPDATTGVLVLHGFTGSPASMLPWARSFADAGLRVDLPRLPGHGTTWQEMDMTRAEDWLAVAEQHWAVLDRECDEVYLAGLSMGGTLALRLAELHDVAGVMLVNPAVVARGRDFSMLRVLRHVARTTRSIANDIALPGQDEHAYERTPLQAAWSMKGLVDQTQADLSRISAEVLLMTSVTDHVVAPYSRIELLARLPLVTDVRLPRSYHVATLDHDAPTIQERSLQFVHDCQARRAARDAR